MKVTIDIFENEVAALKKLLSSEFMDSGKQKLSNLLDSINIALADSPEKVIITYEELVEENERLKGILKGLKFQLGLRDSLLSLQGSNMGSAAADLFINPNPIQIHSTEAGKGIDYMVSLNDILAVVSNGRIKTIHFKDYVIPKSGGKKKLKIETNENFEGLLKRLQKSSHHILRVSDSHAVNIYHYELSQLNTFILITKAPEGFNETLRNIKTEKKFNPELYHTRLMEIYRLSKYHHDFSINLKKIEEISRYKNQ